MSDSNFKLRKMLSSDLEPVLTWRNHPDIRRYMYTQHEISFQEHTDWYHKVSQDSDYHLLIFEVDDVPLGFVNIHLIAVGGIAEWGFYTSPNAPKGTGSILGESTLQYTFDTIKLHKLCGQALGFNVASINFHKRLGFQEEGRLKQHHYDGERYHDVIFFGILNHEWHTTNYNES